MSNFKLTYKPFGERSILIEWPSKIDKNILYDILSFKNSIETNSNSILEIKHAYCSLLISYNFFIEDYGQRVEKLKLLYSEKNNFKQPSKALWKIPVCYDSEFATDLNELSISLNLTEQEIISIHTKPTYLVYFVGFLPGFLYLGGLNKKLHYPRKSSPRLQITKGAVAIGGNQTGVYPNESPGGWNIIGNSPIHFFNVNLKLPCFAKAGDKIQFYSISKNEYTNIKALVEAGVYQLESEVIND